MAGSAETTTTTNVELESPAQSSQSFAVIDQRKVQYARFINYNSCTLRRTHPSLTPLAKSRLRRGTWMSTVAGSLKLIYERSSNGGDDAVLELSLGSRVLVQILYLVVSERKVLVLLIQEEHYISKMHFSWPQVSCVSGFPARGSRAVLIEKFALRFFTIYETEKFMNLVKEILGNGHPKLLQCPEFYSELSSQAEVIPSDVPTCRTEVDCQCTASVDNQPELRSSELNATQDSEPYETIRDYEAANTVSVFPPSFTELLKNCLPSVSEAEKPTESEGDLKTQFMRYLEGTSFKELLATVENVVSELGDDIEP
ncbi:protein POOR HOMOLOGOUS SYNAPSIS 1 [Sesamum alatum]|uniref:Protein POOR HOMOLOGOUS SYNAPSIS 1 n=1 Tax=Sesamum alatum TaxID=300844 RepID=A0AAE1Y5S1_9LAMI|nr:protein POOR HOMOLOGOUS SYNAPSIS 1 [Sesamum alatum]